MGDHVETLVVPQILRPLRAGFARQLERFQHERQIGLAHLSFSFALPFALACDWRRPHMPIVFHWHNPPRGLLQTGNPSKPHSAPLRSVASGIAARFVDRRVIDAHVVVSKEIGGLLVTHGWTCLAKVIHLPSALPRVPTVLETTHGVDPIERDFVIGSVANFRTQKDHYTLLRAFELVRRTRPHSRLILVGDGPTRGASEALAAALGLGNAVEFIGFVDDPTTAYPRWDVFVLSTHYEGQGLVLLEAMGHGLPVVATDLPAIRETVREGIDGLLVAPRDPAALAAAIERLMREPALRRSLGQSGRARVLSEFTISTWTMRLLALYDRLLDRDAAP